MQKHIYTVKDTKVEVYLQPIFNHSDELMVRDITMAVNDEEHPLSKGANSYQLYRLGIFDDETGKFDLYDAPEHLVNLQDLKKD